MKPIISTDARRYCHLLTYVFRPDEFFQQPFTRTEFIIHLKSCNSLITN